MVTQAARMAGNQMTMLLAPNNPNKGEQRTTK